MIQAKPPELEIPESNPFCHDALDRRPAVEVLSQFVCHVSQPFVLALDAPWGTGKTTFVKMWSQHLRNEGVPTVYFNAWESDYVSDPFVALVGELTGELASLSSLGPESQSLKKVKKIAASVAKRAIPVAIRIATGGVLDLSEGLENKIETLAGEIVSDQIAAYEASKDELQRFRLELARTVASLTTDPSRLTPLIVFVDEMDRCRPSYSVELLEKIKHLFGVQGIVFVLAVDKRQLENSVRALYGPEIDASGYLRRFIDLDYRLPDSPSKGFCKHLFERLGIGRSLSLRKQRNSSTEVDTIIDLSSALVEVFGFSLRVQTQFLSRLLVVLSTIPDEQRLYEAELVTLLALREWNPELYNSYAGGHITHKEILNGIRDLPSGSKFLDQRVGILVEAVLAAGAATIREDLQLVHEYEQQSDGSGAVEAIRDRSGTIRDIIRDFNMPYRGLGIHATLRRIALGQQFVVRDANDRDS